LTFGKNANIRLALGVCNGTHTRSQLESFPNDGLLNRIDDLIEIIEQINHEKYDLIVVGGGIIGTFCAFHALKKGKTVLLLEKDTQPFEASFRNFGQAVPSGQSLNKWFDYGRKSLKIYKDLQEETNISLVKNGSWYYASDDQEVTLLEEIQKLFSERSYTSRLYTAAECLEINPALQKNYVKGGLFMPEEASLNPLVMVHKVREFMIQHMGLHYQNLCSVIDVEKTGHCQSIHLA